MKTRRITLLLLLFFAVTIAAAAQTEPAQPGQAAASQAEPAQPTAPPAVPPAPAYQPKFPGDPAHSDAEAHALGYLRVVVRAQTLYKKRHQKYATSLADLAGTGSFTKRMARSTDRGDYTVDFDSKNKGESYTIAMVPKQYDAQHRAFFADEDGIIHAEEGKPATEESPKIK